MSPKLFFRENIPSDLAQISGIFRKEDYLSSFLDCTFLGFFGKYPVKIHCSQYKPGLSLYQHIRNMYMLHDEGKRFSGDGVLFQHLKNNFPSCEWSVSLLQSFSTQYSKTVSLLMLPKYRSCQKTLLSVAHILVYHQWNRKHRKIIKHNFFSGLKKSLKLNIQSSASVCIPHD